MKTINFLKLFLFAISLLVINVACVHDDEYSSPPVECQDFDNTVTIADVKAMYDGSATVVEITEDVVLEGYVSSSDESGNIYKTLYIQDAPENPTHGLTVSVNATDMYTRFPVGSKVFIKIRGLYLGQYGGVIQLGGLETDETLTPGFGRISLQDFENRFFRGCGDLVPIVPKVITIGQNDDNLIGALIKIENAEFQIGLICTTYAVEAKTINKTLTDCNNNTILVRNSGYSNFYNAMLPSGNGAITAIFSKFQSSPTSTPDYQLYIRDLKDTEAMTGTRCGGTYTDNSSIQAIKALYNQATAPNQITQDLKITATVTANDQTGNLYKLLYIQDDTGGIRLRLNRTNLFLDPRFKIGAEITINVKDLYVDMVSGELHLGGLYNGNIGNIEDSNIDNRITCPLGNNPIAPTTINIANSPNLDAQVGKLVKFENVEFNDASAGLPYAGNSDTNRTFKDCNGNTMIVRTSSFATFKSQTTPTGKGSLVGVLSVFNGTYQIWLRTPNEVMMNGNRCDGSVPATTLYFEDFATLSNWTAVSVSGAQVWNTTTFGNPGPSAIMSGFAGGANNVNEDWLISGAISLSGYTNYNLNFETDGRYNGPALEVFATNNYTGNPATTTWTPLSVTLDSNLGAFSTWTNSGNVSLNSFAGGSVRIAFKYTSTASASTTWEVDNVKVKGSN